MNTEYLKTYLEIIRRGSFSEAARSLELSQPAVTFQIQKLERELGTRLLDRREGTVTLTPAGEEFRHFAERIIEEEAALTERLHRLSGEIGGKLMLGASTVPGEFILPKLLGEFHQRYPAVEVSLSVADTDMVVEKVLTHQCDVGFIGAQARVGNLQSIKFIEDDILLVVPPSHPFARRSAVRLEELKGEQWISRETGSGTQQSVRQMLEGAGYDWKNWMKASVFGSTQAALSAVEAGLGISFISRFAAEKGLELDKIRSVPIEKLTLKRDLYIIYQEQRMATGLLKEFLSFVQIWSRDQEYNGPLQ